MSICRASRQSAATIALSRGFHWATPSHVLYLDTVWRLPPNGSPAACRPRAIADVQSGRSIARVTLKECGEVSCLHPPCADGAKDCAATNPHNRSCAPSAQGGWGRAILGAPLLADHLGLHRHKADGGQAARNRFERRPTTLAHQQAAEMAGHYVTSLQPVPSAAMPDMPAGRPPAGR
jgi:hypothetical protein